MPSITYSDTELQPFSARSPLAHGRGAVPPGFVSCNATVPGGAVFIPCQTGNNSIDTESKSQKLTNAQKKQIFAFKDNVQRFVKRYPSNSLGMLTLTFQQEPKTGKEANKLYDSLNTNLLSYLFLDKIKVIEWGDKTNRLHYHLIVACRGDIKTGFDYEHKKLTSLNAKLLNILAILDEDLPKYGFGFIVDLQPIQYLERIANYLGNYLVKGFYSKKLADKGLRLFSFSRKTIQSTVKFSWLGSGHPWRDNLRRFAEYADCDNLQEMKQVFGPHWQHRLRWVIERIDDIPGPLLIKIVEVYGQDLFDNVKNMYLRRFQGNVDLIGHANNYRLIGDNLIDLHTGETLF